MQIKDLSLILNVSEVRYLYDAVQYQLERRHWDVTNEYDWLALSRLKHLEKEMKTYMDAMARLYNYYPQP